ncbi:hypothetical protein ACIGO9_22265 [Nocardia asteroides]|uniref:LppU/SCO3897 family protein n=1 Tax=Nocardia asteroides TaxID=1824 RepID=UPI0037CB506B
MNCPASRALVGTSSGMSGARLMARRKNFALVGVSVVAILSLAGSFYVALSLIAGVGDRMSSGPETEAAATASMIEVSATQPLGNILDLSGGIASTMSKSATKVPRVDLNVGDCVNVGATEIQPAACGSANSRYRVAEVAAGGGACPADTDRPHARTLPGGIPETVCLDIDWTVGACLNLAGGGVEHVDCAAAVPGRVRVLEIRHDTTDVNVCTAGDRGVVYGERRYVVCVSSR